MQTLTFMWYIGKILSFSTHSIKLKICQESIQMAQSWSHSINQQLDHFQILYLNMSIMHWPMTLVDLIFETLECSLDLLIEEWILFLAQLPSSFTSWCTQHKPYLPLQGVQALVIGQSTSLCKWDAYWPQV